MTETTKAAAAFALLDRSGSMAGIWVEAVGSLNGYFEKLGKEAPDTVCSLAVFDDQEPFKAIRVSIPAAAWSAVDSREAAPRGMTPLYDAIVKLVAQAETYGAERTTLLISTDGEENHSKEATKATAKAALDRCQAKGWDVIFLGVNFDAMKQAADLGVMANKVVNVTPGHLGGTTAALAMRGSAYAKGTLSAKADLGDEVRSKAGWPGAPVA